MTAFLGRTLGARGSLQPGEKSGQALRAASAAHWLCQVTCYTSLFRFFIFLLRQVGVSWLVKLLRSLRWATYVRLIAVPATWWALSKWHSLLWWDRSSEVWLWITHIWLSILNNICSPTCLEKNWLITDLKAFLADIPRSLEWKCSKDLFESAKLRGIVVQMLFVLWDLKEYSFWAQLFVGGQCRRVLLTAVCGEEWLAFE